jgi:hypothetical protein
MLPNVRTMKIKFIVVTCRAIYCLAGLSALSACGGGESMVVPQVAPAVIRTVEVVDVPDLSRCLQTLGGALRMSPTQPTVGLHCATGLYRGLTGQGYTCQLFVDGASGDFRFEGGRDVVAIRWADVATTADGHPIHNLEDASAPDQPGVQLTRFTGGFPATTEALILRVGSGEPALPKMTYRRTQGQTTSEVVCQFGA